MALQTLFEIISKFKVNEIQTVIKTWFMSNKLLVHFSWPFKGLHSVQYNRASSPNVYYSCV